MPNSRPGVVRSLVQLHGDEAVWLRNMRRRLGVAPQTRLLDLARHDERIAAHLDGLLLAGEQGVDVCTGLLGSAGAGEVFVAAVIAIEHADAALLERLFAVAQAVPPAACGLLSGFGWVSSQFLQGTAARLLASELALQRQAGLAACAMHRVDPGAALTGATRDSDVHLRARALRAAGECGRKDLLAICLAMLADQDADCRGCAAHSAVLLGDRGDALKALQAIALTARPGSEEALGCVLRILGAADAKYMLARLATDALGARRVVRGAGICGDSLYMPWLIRQMKVASLARLAGEAFSTITGIDLDMAQLSREQPPGVAPGPNDNPGDDDVAMDEDDGLPWPDPVQLQSWWDVNHHRFEPGVRYFLGERVTVEHCRRVLREGFQRQRAAAAEYLCLLTPGTPLFPTSAPAWRQQRWLRQMG